MWKAKRIRCNLNEVRPNLLRMGVNSNRLARFFKLLLSRSIFLDLTLSEVLAYRSLRQKKLEEDYGYMQKVRVIWMRETNQ